MTNYQLSYVKSIIRAIAFGGLAAGYIPAAIAALMLLVSELLNMYCLFRESRKSKITVEVSPRHSDYQEQRRRYDKG
jgi:hypothetical protein